MSRPYYYISPFGSQWKITVDDRPGQQWTYATKAEAIAAAMSAAHSTKQKGVDCGIKVQLANGQWQEERTYGADPFPPRG